MNQYNNVDFFAFSKLNNKQDIIWLKKEKKTSSDYKNSTIFFGVNRNKNKVLCMKQIPLGNIDFENVQNPSLCGDDDITAWRELIIVKKLQKFHEENASKNFIHYYTSFLIEEEKPHIALLFDYVPFTLQELLQLTPFSRQDEIEFILQFSFLMMYLDNNGVHHRDLHWKNIMVDVPEKPTTLHFKYQNLNIETTVQHKIYFIVDYGYSEIRTQKSNFYEWKKFLSMILKNSHSVLKSTSYSDVFKYLHSLNLWKFGK
jgi:serine/threonine protein kinase